MISIIVPVYNVENYIKQCLDSIYIQKFADYEVILVDDGSTDCSGKICDEYAQMYKNTVVIHKANDGLYQARLDGIDIASGDWILFLDSDDWLMPNSLNIISKKIAENSLVDFIIFRNCVNGDVENIGDNGISEGIYADKELSAIYDVFFKTESINAVWKKCFKSCLLKNNRFLKSISGFNYGEDVYITACAMAYSHCVLVIKDVLYSYRKNANSMTVKHKIERIENQVTAFDAYYLLFDNLELNNKKDEYIMALRNKCTRECLMELWILVESGLTIKDTVNEMKCMFNTDMFEIGFLNNDYHSNKWWEKYLYNGIKSNMNNYVIVIILVIIRKITKGGRILKNIDEK